MKKFLAIILGAIFVLSFAASAFAIHAEIPSETQAVVAKGATQVSIDGEIRTRGWYEKNIVGGQGAPLETGSEAWYDERIRLSIDAKVSPNVEGYIQLESGNDKDGKTANNSDLITWGTPGFNSKIGQPSILQAWILYTGSGLFGAPAGIKIGHMPLALGDKQFFDHTKFGDDAIVLFMDPTKELHIAALTIKFLEGLRTDNTDDLDGYVALAVWKWDPKNTVGLNYTFLNLSDAGKKESNIELHAAGNIAGFLYKFSGDYQFGDKANDVKAKGYGFSLGLGYQLDAVALRLAGAYGSGSDSGDRLKGEKVFDTFLGNDQHYSLVYEYRVIGATGSINTGISNTTYINLGADFGLMKDLTASIDGYGFWASHSNPGVFNSFSDSRTIGWEIDAKAIYNIAKNLTYQVDAGVLFTGDFYGDNGKNATVLRHALTLSF